jgi:hypothetical protein
MYEKQLEELERNQSFLPSPSSSGMHTHGHMEVLWVDIKPYDEYGTVDPSEEIKINDAIRETENFFKENSGGIQTFNITRVEYNMTDYSRSGCADYDNSASAITLGIKARNAMDPLRQYRRRVLSFYKGCPMLRFAGLAVVRGVDSYVNRAQSLVVAHELGHNNGLHHAGRGTSEYGSRLSVMGAYAVPPSGHFTVGGKAALRWLTHPVQIFSIAAENDNTCYYADYCPSKGQVWLFSHNTGSYLFNRTYGIRAHMDQPESAIWIEYRSKYANTRGVHAIFSLERTKNVVPDVNQTEEKIYGPSQTLDFQIPQGGESFSAIPVNATAVISLRDRDLLITPIKYSSDQKAVLVRYEYSDPGQDSFLLTKNGSEEISTLSCEESKTFHVKNGWKLVKILMEHPSQFIVKTRSCTGLSTNSQELTKNGRGLYFFTSYPTNLEKYFGDDADLRAHSAHNARAKSFVACKNQDFYVSGVFEDKYNKYGRLYEDFRQEYYMLINTGTEGNHEITVDIKCSRRWCKRGTFQELDAATNEKICLECPLGTTSPAKSLSSEYCYKECDTLQVERNNNGATTILEYQKRKLPYFSNHFFVEVPQGQNSVDINTFPESIIGKYGSDWGYIGKGFLARGWGTITEGGPSTAEYPTGIPDSDIKGGIKIECPTTDSPTTKPTAQPSTSIPTTAPTFAPSTSMPTKSPTFSPTTQIPSRQPTTGPTKSPTFSPTTQIPSPEPTTGPTKSPTVSPTTQIPSPEPTTAPSFMNTLSPTFAPSKTPTLVPTNTPSFSPTFTPSSAPTQGCPFTESFHENARAKSLLFSEDNLKIIGGGKDRQFRGVSGVVEVRKGVHIWNIRLDHLRGSEHVFLGIKRGRRYLYKHQGKNNGIVFRGNGEVWIDNKRYRYWSDPISPKDIVTIRFDADKGELDFFSNETLLGSNEIVSEKLHNINTTMIEEQPYYLIVSISYRWRVRLTILNYDCIGVEN